MVYQEVEMMTKFEDILDNLVNSGYTIVAILSNDDPYKRTVIVKDSTGTQTIKHYALVGFTEVTDANGNVIGVEEDWQEVSV